MRPNGDRVREQVHKRLFHELLVDVEGEVAGADSKRGARVFSPAVDKRGCRRPPPLSVPAAVDAGYFGSPRRSARARRRETRVIHRLAQVCRRLWPSCTRTLSSAISTVVCPMVSRNGSPGTVMIHIVATARSSRRTPATARSTVSMLARTPWMRSSSWRRISALPWCWRCCSPGRA